MGSDPPKNEYWQWKDLALAPVQEEIDDPLRVVLGVM
jgi:hypothetical protein